MPDHSIPPVPPGSTALRQLALAVKDSLALPAEAGLRPELLYLRIARNRARKVVEAMHRLLQSFEDDDEAVMAEVTRLRAEVEAVPDHLPDYRPLS